MDINAIADPAVREHIKELENRIASLEEEVRKAKGLLQSYMTGIKQM
jgi:hypothetical protein